MLLLFAITATALFQLGLCFFAYHTKQTRAA